MIIKANGKEFVIEPPMSIEEFVMQLNLNPKRCVIEINGVAMRYDKFKEMLLKDGDILEVMQIVAGG